MPRGHKFEFTEEQKKYIIDNWGKQSPYSMRKVFGCSWEAITKYAASQGLEIPKSNAWTEEEINRLKKLSDKYHYKKIAKIMNRSETAIELKARRLGIILIRDRRKWTKEEETYLSDFWGAKPIEYIAKKLKRTVFSLKVKAVRMRLGPMINNNYELITINDISELLNVSYDRIINKWMKLGLKLQKTKFTNNASYYTIKWSELIEFLENNQDEWDSRNLEINMLGTEPNWLIEKRKRDKEENPLWYRRWTEEEIDKAEELYKKGKTYKEISVIINRSEQSVAFLLRKLGYSYTMPMYWKGHELKFLRDNVDNMSRKELSEILGRTEKAVSAKIEELGYQKRRKRKDE